MDWMTLIAGVAGVLLPALLAKLKINVPVIVPGPVIPQVPSVDEPLIKCDQLLDLYAAKSVVPDVADIDAMKKIRVKIDGVLVSLNQAV